MAYLLFVCVNSGSLWRCAWFELPYLGVRNHLAGSGGLDFALSSFLPKLTSWGL